MFFTIYIFAPKRKKTWEDSRSEKISDRFSWLDRRQLMIVSPSREHYKWKICSMEIEGKLRKVSGKAFSLSILSHGKVHVVSTCCMHALTWFAACQNLFGFHSKLLWRFLVILPKLKKQCWIVLHLNFIVLQHLNKSIFLSSINKFFNFQSGNKNWENFIVAREFSSSDNIYFVIKLAIIPTLQFTAKTFNGEEFEV